MALSVKRPEADRLARALSRATGESITEAVTTALRQRLVRETGADPDSIRAEIVRIRHASLPRRSTTTAPATRFSATTSTGFRRDAARH